MYTIYAIIYQIYQIYAITYQIDVSLWLLIDWLFPHFHHFLISYFLLPNFSFLVLSLHVPNPAASRSTAPIVFSMPITSFIRSEERKSFSITWFPETLISVVTPWFDSLRKYAMVYLWFHVTRLVTSVPQIEWKKWPSIHYPRTDTESDGIERAWLARLALL